MPKNSTREAQRRSLLSFLARNAEETPLSLDLKGARELLSNLANWAGKGKDEIVQLICREIGYATAAVLKEPITQILKDKKLQLTLELIPKEVQNVDSANKTSNPKKSKKTKKKQASRSSRPHQASD